MEGIGEPLGSAVEDTPLDGLTHQKRDHSLGHGANGVDRLGRSRAQIALADETPAPDDHRALQARDSLGQGQRPSEPVGVDVHRIRRCRAPLGGEVDRRGGGPGPCGRRTAGKAGQASEKQQDPA